MNYLDFSKTVAGFLIEEDTIQEATKEFNCSKDVILRCLEYLSYSRSPKEYNLYLAAMKGHEMAKNKPIFEKAIQVATYAAQGHTIAETLEQFSIGRTTYSRYLDLLSKNPNTKGLAMRARVANIRKQRELKNSKKNS